MQKKTVTSTREKKAATVVSARTTKAVRKKSHSKHISGPYIAEELRVISEEISLRAWPVPTASRLELMEIDPWNVHAYWHIQASDMANCRSKLARKGLNAKLVLRFNDVSPKQDQNGVHDQFDIDVTEGNDNWYVNLWRDGKHYLAEIGLRTEEGIFEVLATSNEVITPHAYPSAEFDFYLADIRAPSMPEPATTIIPRISDDHLLINLFPKRLSLEEAYSRDEQKPSSLLQDELALPALDETERENGASRVFPLLDQREIEKYGALTRKTREEILADTQFPALDAPPSGSVAPTGVTFDTHSSAIPQASLQEGAMQLSHAEVLGHTGEGAGVLENRGGGYYSSPVPLEMHLGLSTLTSSAVDSPFSNEAKLVIEGTCPPGTHLLFFGERVDLAPDGNFCIQLPLERGPELLEFMYRVRSKQAKG
jgi:hypothetical protein